MNHKIYSSKLRVAALDQVNRFSEIPIFPAGEFQTHHDAPEGFTLDSNFFNQIISNFDQDIPVYVGHPEENSSLSDRPAVGWVKKLINKTESGLWGLVEWTEKGLELLQEKAYRYISPEWMTDYTDPRSGEYKGAVLCAPALVNEPYFKMPPITASEQKNLNNIIIHSMDIQELLKKPLEELSDEEKAFVKESYETLEAEAKEHFKSLLGETPPVEDPKPEAEKEAEGETPSGESGDVPPEDKKPEPEAPAGDTPVAPDAETPKEEEPTPPVETPATAEEPKTPAEGEEPKTASDVKGFVRITASELKRLQAADKKLMSAELEARLNAHIPAVRDAAVAFAFKMTASADREEFMKIMEAVEVGGIKKERITSGKDYAGLTATEAVRQRMHDIAKDKKISLSDAFDEVQKEIKAAK